MSDRPGARPGPRLFLLAAALIVIPVVAAVYRGIFPHERIREPISKEEAASFPLLEIEEGDALFDKGDYDDAVGVYKRILSEDPKDYEVLWRLARCYNMMGIVYKEMRSTYIPISISYARQAIELDGSRFEGHLYLAESLGISLKYETLKNKVIRAREVREEAEKAIGINPSSYRAYLIMGMWHRNVEEAGWIEKQLAGILFGKMPESSFDEAAANFRKSIALKGDFLKTRYELGMTYLAMQKKELAIEEFEAALRCPVNDIKEGEVMEKAKNMLNQLRVKAEGEV